MTKDRLRTASILMFLALFTVFVLLAAGCGSSNQANTTNTEDEQLSAEEAVEGTVNRFFRAVNNLDAGMLAMTFNPQEVKDYEDETGKTFESLLKEYWFGEGEPTTFKSLKYDVVINGKEATVTVTRGKISYMGGDGQEVTENITREDGITFDLVKVGDRWYIAMSSFPDLTTGNSTASTPTPSPTPAPTPKPAPSTTYTECPTCGGSGYIICSDCSGEGGYYVDYSEVCPDCGGTGTFICWYCGGSGIVEEGDGTYTCEVCGGSGYSWCGLCGGSGYIGGENWVSCPTCGGSGYEGCPTCGSTGWVQL
jgi:hypothetical protein